MTGLIRKSKAAADSARLLFDKGDYDGAVSRAYYAMFDATRAYLQLRHSVDLFRIKTHAGILTTFNSLAINQDKLPIELIRILNRAGAQRKQADYDEGGLTRDAAAQVLIELAEFLQLVLPHLGEPTS